MSRQQQPQKKNRLFSIISKKITNLKASIDNNQATQWQKTLMFPLRVLALVLTEIQKAGRKLIRFVSRRLLLPGKIQQFSRSGFLLPTVAVLLVVLSLVVASLLKQSQERTTQVIAERQEQVTYNAATPAIDRSKAKIQYLFTSDPRWPRRLPPDEFILSMMLNDGQQTIVADIDPLVAGNQNPYTLPDETQLDLDKDGTLDLAWRFTTDTDGDGDQENIAYGLFFRSSGAQPGNPAITVTRAQPDAAKAKALIVRNGPINMNFVGSGACDALTADVQGDVGGWDVINGATVRRAFQVTAVVVDDEGGSNRSVTTLEMQQDRQAERGNKWGAWFRYDLEIFNGPPFNWNGAMHTEGNLFVGPTGNRFRAYLISDPKSCMFSRENSEITITGNGDGSAPPFLGQVISGSLRDDNTTTFTSNIDVFKTPPATGTYVPDNYDLNQDTDSVNVNGASVAPMALDPLVMTTNTDPTIKGNNISRNWSDDDTKNNKSVRNSTWASQTVVGEKRVYNRSEIAPFLDDTYRADNRYGPKPLYTQLINLTGKTTGALIPNTDPNQGQLINIPVATPEQSGYDGYWERRTHIEGMRVIVGQRLELGNSFGWLGSNDPLNPPLQGNAACLDNDRCHEQRQWRTMRDNLAAVQTTAIYHNDRASDNDPVVQSFPRACLLTTAHPGTRRTILNSTTFDNISLNGTNVINTDFFSGRGTNGWEFNPPAASETAFAAQINNSSSSLRVALRNLANFAGDPFGAFPARQDNPTSVSVSAVGQVTHPYPALRMWGDFSNLRQTLDRLDGAGTPTVNYAGLSIADQSNLHTATCTLGALAYNIDNLQSFDYSTTANRNALDALVNNHLSTINAASLGTSSAGTPDSYIATLPLVGSGSPTPPLNRPQDFARLVHLREQVERDRRLGFRPYSTTSNANGFVYNVISNGFSYPVSINYVPTNITFNVNGGRGYQSSTLTNPPTTKTGIVTPIPGQYSQVILGFDPTWNNYFGFGPPTTPAQEQRFLTLALSLGPDTPKFPSLYYLFPKYNHTHSGGTFINPTGVPSDPNQNINHAQPNTEPYQDTTSNYINNVLINGGTFNYRVVGDPNNNGYEEPSEMAPNAGGAGLKTIEVLPRTKPNWVLPNAGISGRVNLITDNTGSTATTALTNFTNTGINPTTGLVQANVGVAFLDKGIFNGREMMSVRVLDFDLDLLRNSNTNLTNENWLPLSGLVYAFREDAVREDSIERPRSTEWSNCDNVTKLQTNACLMNAIVTNPVDPPVNPANGISAKSVDFYPDPDRRPHGFRLRNGGDLRRFPIPPTDFQLKGLSFVSDNAVYLMADGGIFNLHANLGGTRIEEFDTFLTITNDVNNWSNFYTRGNNTMNSGLNLDFAGQNDRWRPAEIVADGISILSQNFRDGSMVESIRRADINGTSSYRTLNAPTLNVNGAGNWVTEDGSVTNSINYDLPITISRNGYPLYRPASTNLEYGNEPTGTRGQYLAFNDNKVLVAPPADTRINAVIISGINPSRARQSYGGFHNFPRFLENWDGQRLHMSGAFVQLNFSNSATAPFDQDSWEPGDPAQPAENIRYYGAPRRQWGYDVGLQYSPTGPVANRFVTGGNVRSEFYRKLPIDDPYVCILRKATPGGTAIDPNTTDCPP